MNDKCIRNNLTGNVTQNINPTLKQSTLIKIQHSHIISHVKNTRKTYEG